MFISFWYGMILKLKVGLRVGWVRKVCGEVFKFSWCLWVTGGIVIRFIGLFWFCGCGDIY